MHALVRRSEGNRFDEKAAYNIARIGQLWFTSICSPGIGTLIPESPAPRTQRLSAAAITYAYIYAYSLCLHTRRNYLSYFHITTYRLESPNGVPLNLAKSSLDTQHFPRTLELSLGTKYATPTS